MLRDISIILHTLETASGLNFWMNVLEENNVVNLANHFLFPAGILQNMQSGVRG